MHPSNDSHLRDEVAAVAARLIAEDGLDYASAKARALREVLGGNGRPHTDCMPDNALVEAAVRAHQALFMADTQPARLAHLRRIACDVLRFLDGAGLDLDCFAQGAIVNGTAGEHSDVHLVAFNDNAKDVEIFLVNAGVDFDVVAATGRHAGETLSFLWPQRAVAPSPAGPTGTPEAVHLTICDPRDRRGPSGGPERADLATLERLGAAASAATSTAASAATSR